MKILILLLILFSKLDSSYKLKIIGAKKGEEESFNDLLNVTEPLKKEYKYCHI